MSLRAWLDAPLSPRAQWWSDVAVWLVLAAWVAMHVFVVVVWRA